MTAAIVCEIGAVSPGTMRRVDAGLRAALNLT